MTTETIDRIRVARPAVMPTVRGVVLVRDGKTGRPKFDLPMHDYPWWAQEGFRRLMTPREIAEFFG